MGFVWIDVFGMCSKKGIDGLGVDVVPDLVV